MANPKEYDPVKVHCCAIPKLNYILQSLNQLAQTTNPETNPKEHLAYRYLSEDLSKAINLIEEGCPEFSNPVKV